MTSNVVRAPRGLLVLVLLLTGLAAPSFAGSPASTAKLKRHDAAMLTPRVVDKVMPAPIARWRVHAKVLEGICAEDSSFNIVKYCHLAELEPAEITIIYMSLTEATLQQAKDAIGRHFKSLGVKRRLSGIDAILAKEAQAREIELIGSGPNLRLKAIWPPPGYVYRGEAGR
jgi:hypothetical protein